MKRISGWLEAAVFLPEFFLPDWMRNVRFSFYLEMFGVISALSVKLMDEKDW